MKRPITSAAISAMTAILSTFAVTAGKDAPLGVSRNLTERCWERTSMLSTMAGSVFIGHSLDNPSSVDDAFQGAKALGAIRAHYLWQEERKKDVPVQNLDARRRRYVA
jgi:hypothetical protein